MDRWPSGLGHPALWLAAVAAWIGWLLTQHLYWLAAASVLIYGAGLFNVFRR